MPRTVSIAPRRAALVKNEPSSIALSSRVIHWSTTNPAPRLRCPTSELPICPVGRPTSLARGPQRGVGVGGEQPVHHRRVRGGDRVARPRPVQPPPVEDDEHDRTGVGGGRRHQPFLSTLSDTSGAGAGTTLRSLCGAGIDSGKGRFAPQAGPPELRGRVQAFVTDRGRRSENTITNQRPFSRSREVEEYLSTPDGSTRRRRIRVRIARTSIDSSERLGRHRWVVERTVAWLNRYQRLTDAMSGAPTSITPSSPSAVRSSAYMPSRTGFERCSSRKAVV